MNQWLDINDAYIYGKYWLNVDVDPRSRSQGQRSRSNMQFCENTCFGYILSTNDCTLMMHIHRISIVEMLKLTKGQGQKVKGQGQTYKFVKKLIWLYTMNQWLDMDDTCTYDWYQWDVKVDLRSRSQGQRSRSNMQFCENLVLTIYHEPIIRYRWYLHTWLI